MRLELFIGFRYLMAKSRRHNLVSLMSMLSIGGVCLGVMVPVVVMSVLIGFQNEMRSKILGVKSHISVAAPGALGIENYEKLMDELKAYPGVVSVNPMIEADGLVQFYNGYQPVVIRAVTPDLFTNDREFASVFKVTNGLADVSRKNYLLVGDVLAYNHLVDVSNRVTVMLARGTLSPNVEMAQFRAMVTGIFRTGHSDFDRNIVFTSLRTLQDILELPDEVTRLEIKIKNPMKADDLATLLLHRYGSRYSIYSWTELNATLFQALQNERAMIWIILIFILLVAIFNVMGSQIMLVLEKQKEIGILKTLGMKPSHIARIFMFEGLITTVVGAILGAILGMLASIYIKEVLAFIEFFINAGIHLWTFLLHLLGQGASAPQGDFKFFDPRIYYLDKIPADISVMRAAVLVVCAIVLSMLAGLFPSLTAARLRPLEVIRYE